jgi:hypothetical protein
MSSEIESVKPALSVVLDDGDFIINSTGSVGKAMAQAVLPLAASARKVTIITDGEMKVMKRSGSEAVVEGGHGQAAMAQQGPVTVNSVAQRAASQASSVASLSNSESDVQEQFAADLEAGRTGEAATGESSTPTPGPNDPVEIPSRRKPRHQIFQDAAAPPAPELAEAEMARLVEESAQAERDAEKVAEDQRFQRQQAVQAGADESEQAEPAAAKPRKRAPRQLAVTGRACGRCGGAGQIVGESGFQGACPVCHGDGQVQTFARSPKFR